MERWGAQVAPGGQVDRAAVAQRAFASDEDRRWLEGLLWPLVGARVAAWLAEVRSGHGGAPRPRAAVVEIPLLFESGMQDVYDATIAVVSSSSWTRCARRVLQWARMTLDGLRTASAPAGGCPSVSLE